MRARIGIITLFVIGVIVGLLVLGWDRSSVRLAHGELRCESPGAVVINVGGSDYGVNPIGAWRYPPIQRIWNSTTYPETNIDRIIDRGLTLCESGSQAGLYAQR